MAHHQEQDPPEPPDTPISELADAYTDALLHGDEATAEVVLREAMDAGLGPADIDEHVIAPAMWLVGEMWSRGELSVAEEHLATEITLRVLALQREAHRVAQSRPHHRVVLAAPSGEQHVVALRMVANLLRGAGYEVIMLGADVPAVSLGELAARREVDVVCMSATMPGRGSEILAVIDEVRKRRPAVRFVVGGPGLAGEPQLRHEIHVCARVSEAVDVVDAALQRARLN